MPSSATTGASNPVRGSSEREVAVAVAVAAGAVDELVAGAGALEDDVLLPVLLEPRSGLCVSSGALLPVSWAAEPEEPELEPDEPELELVDEPLSEPLLDEPPPELEPPKGSWY
jgi:hypothetical protein